MDNPKVIDIKLQEKKTVNFVFCLLYFIPFLIILVFILLYKNYVFIFQSGLLLLFAVLTGFLINLLWGIDLKNKTQKERNKMTFNSIKENRVNIILGSIVSIIIISVAAYNIGHILITGCTSPDDIELLDDNIEHEFVSLNELKHSKHNHDEEELEIEDINKKRENQFIPNPEVNNFVLDRLCNHEQILFFIFVIFLFYIFFLHIITIYCYLFNVGYLDQNKPSKYYHFVFTLCHFIPLVLMIFFQIILVQTVTVFQTGLLLPFGLVNGIFISILCGSKLTSKHELIFIIKGRSRYLIIITSIFSLIFLCIYLISLLSLYSDCGSSSTSSLNFTQFIVKEICEKEYSQSIILLVFLSYLLILHLTTLIVYSIYYSIKNFIPI